MGFRDKDFSEYPFYFILFLINKSAFKLFGWKASKHFKSR